MQITTEPAGMAYQINSYTDKQITINQEQHHNSLIISPTCLISPWQPQQLEDITAKDWLQIIELQPDVLLLGTGTNLQFPKDELLAMLYERKISVEPMDTGAACRTFMALCAEGRNVAAALIIK